jgi:hypothetical protein
MAADSLWGPVYLMPRNMPLSSATPSTRPVLRYAYTQLDRLQPCGYLYISHPSKARGEREEAPADGGNTDGQEGLGAAQGFAECVIYCRYVRKASPAEYERTVGNRGW